MRPVHKVVDGWLAPRRFSPALLPLFGMVALLLAGVGVYGMMSNSVAQRTHEIGIRMALGAQMRDVLNLVVRNGMALPLIGVAIGLAGSFALTRLMTTLLFDVTPTDAATLVTVSVGLIAVALLACYIPARRATFMASHAPKNTFSWILIKMGLFSECTLCNLRGFYPELRADMTTRLLTS